jgi:hypothetical protein
LPDWQVWPVAQGGPPPHPQPASLVLHVPSALQQPEHDVASQMHEPPAQCCPAAHAADEPQVQAPPREQPSAVTPQTPHALPGGPQAVGPCFVSHVEPAQHPLQVSSHPEHAPSSHAWPVGHALQPMPPTPHADAAVPAWQVPSAAQQPAHVVGSQTHAPREQRCPVAHAGPVPHSHAPAAVQPSLVTPHPPQTHAPDTHVWPGAHGSPVPHVGPVLV